MLPRLPPSPHAAAVELRAKRAHELASRALPTDQTLFSVGGRCTASAPNCLGGQYCVHGASRALAGPAMRDSLAYEYGINENKRIMLYRVIGQNLVHAHMPLSTAVQCGLNTTLLAFAGVTLSLLLDADYTIEELIATLHLTWDDLLVLGFTPWMLQQNKCSLIVLYDRLGMRRDHLYQFTSLTADAARQLLSDNEVALLGIRWDAWRQ